jgi:hypothetical protein
MINLRNPAMQIKQSLGSKFSAGPTQYNDSLVFAIGQAGISANRNRYDNVISLWDIDFRVFSQFGDDGIIDFLCSRLSLYKPVFIEIGTEDYGESNTRFLYQLRTSRGLVIDCDPGLGKNSQNRLGSFFWKGEIILRSAFVTLDNACSLIHDFENADILSLDIDGNDYWVLDALLLGSRPKILIVEFNAYFGDKKAVSIPYDPDFVRGRYHYSHLVFGASLKAFCILTASSYRFIGTNLHCNNAYFIRHEHVHLMPDSFQLPNIDCLSKYTQNYTRESRRQDGSLSYPTSADRLDLIKDCMLVDLSTSPAQKRLVAEIFNL